MQKMLFSADRVIKVNPEPCTAVPWQAVVDPLFRINLQSVEEGWLFQYLA